MAAIYEQADIAAILGMDKSQVKNWTIGRPFCVRASVRAASGKGSRNLFSREDVFRFAIVKRLNELGVPVIAIQAMLDKKQGDGGVDLLCETPKGWLVIDYKSDGFFVDFHVRGPLSSPTEVDGDHLCRYAINLESISASVSTRISKCLHEGKASTHPRAKRNKKEATETVVRPPSAMGSGPGPGRRR